MERYEESTKGDVELDVDEARGLTFHWFGGSLACCIRSVATAFFMAPVHQQLVESFFSKNDTSCARKTDFSELDEVRTGQYRSRESRKICKVNATPTDIREAGLRRQNDARAARTRATRPVPKAREQRKRPLEGQDVLQGLIAKKRGRRAAPASTRSKE